MASVNRGGPVAALVSTTGARTSLGWTHEQVTLTGGGWKFQTVERDGQKPLTIPDQMLPRKLSWTTHLFTLAGSGVVVETVVGTCQALFAKPTPVRLINVSPHEGGLWLMTGLDVTILERDARQRAKTADLAFELTEYVVNVAPAVGRVPMPPPAYLGPGSSTYNSQVPRAASVPSKYVVKGTDSLFSIALAMYGDGTKWTLIASANRLANALAITPGQVLTIPPPGTPLPTPAVPPRTPMPTNARRLV